MPEDETAEWPAALLSVFCQSVQADVVSYERPTELTRAFEEEIVGQRSRAVLLCRQDIHLPKSQLGRNGVVDVNIEVQADGHRTRSLK
jgi:hypothetical protein